MMVAADGGYVLTVAVLMVAVLMVAVLMVAVLIVAARRLVWLGEYVVIMYCGDHVMYSYSGENVLLWGVHMSQTQLGATEPRPGLAWVGHDHISELTGTYIVGTCS